MQTAATMLPAIRATGLLAVAGGLRVKVRVLDVRQVFGRTDFLVQPTEGEGTTWADASRVALEGKQARTA